MSYPISSDTEQRIAEALYRGNKIEAIKIFRAATSCGLAEAKTAVEQMESCLRETTPASFAYPPVSSVQKGLSFAVVILSLGLIVMGVCMFVDGRGDDRAVNERYTQAFSAVMNSWLILQGCNLVANPRTQKYGYCTLSFSFIFLFVHVMRVLHP